MSNCSVKLSARDLTIIPLLVLGYRDKEMAIRLNVSEDHVKSSVRMLMRKIKHTNRIRVIWWLISNGYATIPSEEELSAYRRDCI